MSGLRRSLKRTFEAPSLILWGDCDRAVPIHSAPELRKRLLHSELITIPGVGHRPAEETPQLVAQCLRTWIEQELPAASSIRYSANVSPSHARTAPLITPSFESGD